MMPTCEKGSRDGFVCLVAQLKSTSPVAARIWGGGRGGRRPSPQPRLRTGEGCTLGQPGRQVAAAPAGWARSNQGCGGPTGAANICSARTRVAEGEAPLSVRMRLTLRRVETVPFEKHQSDQAASVSNIKWTAPARREKNTAVVPPLPFVLILCLRHGLTIRLLSPECVATVY